MKREEMLKKRMLGIPVSSGSTTIDVYRSTDNQIAQQFKIPYECKHGCQWFAPDPADSVITSKTDPSFAIPNLQLACHLHLIGCESHLVFP